MKINKIREMSSPDLEKELGELKSELFKLRFSLATNGLDNPMKIREVKKDIAKIKTVLTERELKGEEPVVAEEPKKAEKKTASKAKKKLQKEQKRKLEKQLQKKKVKLNNLYN